MGKCKTGQGFLVQFIFLLFVVLVCFSTVSGNNEGDVLNALKNNLVDEGGVLSSWNASLPNPCKWFHVTCNNDSHVTRVGLGKANLTGRLVPDLGQLSFLEYLELYDNNLSGNIPPEIGNLTNLLSLDLYKNHLDGPIPVALGKLSKLRYLRLNNNSLDGTIPLSLTEVYTLQYLDLSYNNLSGEFPVNGSFSFFGPSSYKKNPKLKQSTPAQPPMSQTPPSSPSVVNGVAGLIAGAVAAGAALSFAAPTIALALWRRRKAQDHFFDVPAEEEPEVHLDHLKRFSLWELQVATGNFSHKNILGRGGYGDVYKGQLADGQLVAAKRWQDRTQVAELQFQTEVEINCMVVHRNLIRLLGFCMSAKDWLLVYPYVANGSVASCLRERSETQPPLDWPKRKRIALGVARGLSYLHDHNPKIIHRDVKAANVLLDEKFEAVVGDFGLSMMMDFGDTHVTTQIIGTLGHLGPEYIGTGRLSEKTDVYGYGAILLELVTSQRTSDQARCGGNDDDILLIKWVKRHLMDGNLEMLVDSTLQGNYIKEEAEQLVQIALLCTRNSPFKRPKMSEVLRMLEGDGLTERWEEWQEEETFRQNINPLSIVNPTIMPTAEELSGPR